MKEIILQLIAAAVRIMMALVLSAGSLYVGMRVLDRMTAGLEEWKEIKKGNLAVGLFYAAVLISLMILVAPRIEEVILFLDVTLPLKLLAFSIVNFLISLPLSIIVIYLAIHLIDRLTGDVSEISQIKKGNLSMSLVFSVSVLLVSFMTIVPMESLFLIIKSLESLLI
jgi:uncharacterized membrane protein YjfL (UPF0719 family)